MAQRSVKVSDIKDVSGEVNIAGRDIIKNIKTIHQRAMTAAEEAARDRKIERKLLAQGVSLLVQNLSTQASQTTEGDSPYKGLLAYNLNEAEIFFGRNEAKKDLLKSIKHDPLTVLHAESGAGKSSLLQAGIAAHLIANGHLAIRLRSHNADPVEFIKRTFLPELSQAPNLAKASLREFLQQVCAVLGAKVSLYLLLDQFEEFFHLLRKEKRKPFLEALADCLNDPSLKVRWVLALRAEALSDLAELEPLGIAPFKNLYRLNRLSRAEAEEAISEPAKRYGINFEQVLIDHILDTLTTNHEITPTQLQLVCSALIDDLPQDKTLTLAYYTDREGGTEGILRDYLKRQLEHLPAEEQASAWKVLRALITADRLRAVKTHDEIVEELKLNGISNEKIDILLARLVERRLLATQPAITETFELAHDYLVKEIEIDPQEQARKAAQELLDQETRSYQRHRTLLSAERLAVIEPYQEALRFSSEAETLLRESRKAVRQEQLARERRRNITLGISFVVAIAMSVLAYWGFRSSQDATKQAEEAQKQAKIALSRQLAVQSGNNTENQYDLALLLSAEAERNADTQEGQASELHALLYNGPLLTYLNGHSAPVTSVAFSPDNKTLASADANGNIILWDRESHSILHQIATTHHTPILRMAFSSDGKLLVSASYGNRHSAVDRPTAQVMIWKVSTASLVKQLAANATESFSKATISSDARWVAFINDKDEVVLWDVLKDAYIERTPPLGDEPSLAFGSEGEELTWVAPVTTNTSSSTVLGPTMIGQWNVSQGRGTTPESIEGHKNLVDSMVLSPDGHLIATASQDGSVVLHEFGTSTPIGKFFNSSWLGTIEERGMAFNRNGNMFALGDGAGAIQIYDAHSGQTLGEKLRGHSGDVLSLAFAPDNDLLASGGQDGKVILWEPNRNRLAQDFDGAQSIIYDRTGKTFAVLNDSTVKLFNSDTGSQLGRSFVVSPSTRLWAFTPDGRGIVSSDYPGGNTVYFWDTQSGILIDEPIQHPTSRMDEVALSPDGRLLATTSARGDAWVFLWDLPSRRQTTLKYGPTGFSSISFSPDSHLLAAGTYGGQIILWDMATRSLKTPPLPGHSDWVSSIAFSPNGKYVASGGADRVVKLWDVTSGQLYGVPLVGHKALVQGLAFSGDGSILASVGGESEIILWDIKTSREIGRLPAQGNQLMFDPRLGRMILANGSMLWNLNRESRSDMICRTVNRNLSFDEWNRFLGADRPYQLTCPNLPIHPTVLEHARELARTGHTDEAIAQFRQLLVLQPDLGIDPEEEVKHLADEARARELVGEARKLALAGEVSGAVTKFQEALRLDPGLHIDATQEAQRIADLAPAIQRLAKDGQIKAAIAAFNEAQSIDPTYKIPAQSLNQLCRSASLFGYVWNIVNTDVCNLAVEFARNADEEAKSRDSRGIAFVLGNWDYETAISDFQAYVKWSKQSGLYEKYGKKRELWIQELQAGQMPFDENTIKDLRNE